MKPERLKVWRRTKGSRLGSQPHFQMHQLCRDLLSLNLTNIPGPLKHVNFLIFKLVLEKAEEPEIKLPTSAGSW